MKTRNLLAVLAAGLCACGPTEREVGSWVLLVLPAIVFLGGLIQLGYRALWRKVIDRAQGRAPSRPTLGLLAVSVGLLVIPLVTGEIDDDALIALWAAGTTYASYLLLSMRITIGSDRRYAWSALVPWLLIAAPAVWFALFGSTTRGDFAQLYYMLPGYAGLVPGVMAALMLCEIGVRRHLRARRERALEPVFPEARVHGDFD